MFRCQICGLVAAVGTRAHRVVLVSRPKNYNSRGGLPEGQRRFRGAKMPKREYDKGGKGHEIVREVLACDHCAKQASPAMEAAPEPIIPETEIGEDSQEIQATESAS